MSRVVTQAVVLGVALATAAVGLAGCGGGGGDGAADGPTATVPTTPPDPYAVPAVIDEAYVNRVLAALDAATGDVVRIVVSTRTLTPEAIERLQALYVGDALNSRFNVFQNDIFNGLSGYKTTPGNKRTTVAELITATRSCVFAKVSRDFSAVTDAPDARLSIQWIALIPRTSPQDPESYNPTAWVFSYDGFPLDGSEPSNPCVGTS